MDEILNQNVILTTTILKPCRACGLPRGAHTQGRHCTVEGWTCQRFAE